MSQPTRPLPCILPASTEPEPWPNWPWRIRCNGCSTCSRSVSGRPDGKNKKGPAGPFHKRTTRSSNLRRVVHLVFDRMRGVLELDHLGHLEIDVAVDLVVVEHAAGLQEIAVGI